MASSWFIYWMDYDAELLVWLRGKVENPSAWWTYIRGKQQVLADMRFDKSPSSGPHINGTKFIKWKNGEGFVKRVLVTNLYKGEIVLDRVKISPSDRHHEYIKHAVAKEKEALWWDINEEKRVEKWRGTGGLRLGVLHLLARVMGISSRLSTDKSGR